MMHQTHHRLATLLAAVLLLFPTGVPAFFPALLLGPITRVAVPAIGRLIGREVGREAIGRGIECVDGLINGEECGFFDKRHMSEDKREVGEGRQLELVDTSDEKFWNSCVGQTAMNGRPDVEWQGDGSLVMTGVQPACMVDLQWWNELPEIGELEEAMGKFVELEEGKIQWSAMPEEDYAMVKGLTDMYERQGHGKKGPSKNKHNRGGHKNQGGGNHNNKDGGRNHNGGFHRTWQG